MNDQKPAIEQELPKDEEKVTMFLFGTVANCTRLNLRANPSPEAEILQVLDYGTEVLIDTLFVDETFYQVVAKGAEGFCMKEFVQVVAERAPK